MDDIWDTILCTLNRHILLISIYSSLYVHIYCILFTNSMAAKIFDGLFIGDGGSAVDYNFLSMNKIAHLVNTGTATAESNRFSSHGLVYLTLRWEDQDGFDLSSNCVPASSSSSSSSSVRTVETIAMRITEFVDTAIRDGSSVLIFSSQGRGRSAVAICMYLMIRYCWGFDKSVAFVRSRKTDVVVNSGFTAQLYTLERRLLIRRVQQEGEGCFDMRRVKDWDLSVCLSDNSSDKELLNEEILLVN